MPSTDRTLAPGTRVRIVGTIARRESVWTSEVVGEVLAHHAEPTGSWFSARVAVPRSRPDDANIGLLRSAGDDVRPFRNRLVLERIRLRKDDGEETIVTVDPNTRIEVLPGNDT